MQWRRAAEPDMVDSGDEAERSGEDSELEGDGGVRCCRTSRHQTVGAFVCGVPRGGAGCDSYAHPFSGRQNRKGRFGAADTFTVPFWLGRGSTSRWLQ